jgi:imidazolonepropionase-like amidohydrolase
MIGFTRIYPVRHSIGKHAIFHLQSYPTTMKKILILFMLMISSAAPLKAQSDPFALQGVHVITMTNDQVLRNQTILVKNGIIEKLGSSGKIKIPAGYTIIDGKGKYVIPGLFDMHTHFFMEQGEHLNTCEKELNIMLANGLTTARILAGHPEYLKARENVAAGTWAGPQLVVASPQFVGRWPWSPAFKNYEVVNSEEKAQAAVKKFKDEGYDEIKLTFMVAAPVYEAVIAAARENNIKVTGHVGPQVKLPAALRAKQQIEHMDEFIDMLLPDTSYNHGQSVSDMNLWRKKAWETVPYLDESKIPALVKMVKDAGVYVTPTNYFFFSSFAQEFTDEQYKAKPDYQYIPASIESERWDIRKRYWDNAPPKASRDKYIAIRKTMTNQLWRAGVPLMAGSDSPEWFLIQGIALHDELETFVSAGLSTFAALQTATVNPATYLGLIGKTGTIAEGKQADMVLLNNNPLDDIRNTRRIDTVISDGRIMKVK